jgi:hypothetical protein
MPQWLTLLISPITDLLKQRGERKMAKETAAAKLSQAKVDNDYKLEFTDQEWEAISAAKLSETWRDEYVTLSVGSILNIIVVGGLLTAFGHPEVLSGIVIAINALAAIGVDIGFLLEAVVLAALGLSVWRKL